MSNIEMKMALKMLEISQTDLAGLFKINARTVRRWCSGSDIPGPARAAVRAWLDCKKYGLDWREVAKTD